MIEYCQESVGRLVVSFLQYIAFFYAWIFEDFFFPSEPSLLRNSLWIVNEVEGERKHRNQIWVLLCSLLSFLKTNQTKEIVIDSGRDNMILLCFF
jgi:hypothetical protein